MYSLMNVKGYYHTSRGVVKAVDDVSFEIYENEIVGIAGESGCGKSSLMKVLYGYIEPPLHLVSGDLAAEMHRNGSTVVLDSNSLKDYWWDFISYIPQGSMSVLNPVVKIEKQFLDAVKKSHGQRDVKTLKTRIADYLRELELPVEVMHSFPHQLSGGMRQRVLVALATFLHPRIILADEPTTALDVVVQRGILSMLMRVQERMKNTLVLISHDMGVHYQITDRMAIMYAGKIVELGPTEEIFANPRHPYTRLLINSLPRIGDTTKRKGIQGRPPSLYDPPDHCRFADRCPHAMDVCRKRHPPLTEVEEGIHVACFLFDECHEGDGGHNEQAVTEGSR